MELREQIARAICTSCDEHPNHKGDAQGNKYRWQDYGVCADAVLEVIRPIIEERDALRAEIEAMEKQEPVGKAGSMPGTSGFTMACFRADAVPFGSNLYTLPGAQLNLSDPAVQKRLSAQWGYVPAQTAPSVPAGWKLVPIEPTRGMLDRMDLGSNMLYRYRAMLAAAPNPENKE